MSGATAISATGGLAAALAPFLIGLLTTFVAYSRRQPRSSRPTFFQPAAV